MFPLLLAALLGTGEGVVVDRIIAVVDDESITQTEFLAQARIEVARRQGEFAASEPFPAELLESLRDFTINQLLIASEARRMGGELVTEKELDLAVARLTRMFRSADAYKAFLRRFGIGESTVRALLRRDMRNERFIQQVMRTRLSGEVDQRAYEKAVTTWLGQLRDSAAVRVIGPLGLELQ